MEVTYQCVSKEFGNIAEFSTAKTAETFFIGKTKYHTENPPEIVYISEKQAFVRDDIYHAVIEAESCFF